jgi:hypothetical protein
VLIIVVGETPHAPLLHPPYETGEYIDGVGPQAHGENNPRNGDHCAEAVLAEAKQSRAPKAGANRDSFTVMAPS